MSAQQVDATDPASLRQALHGVDLMLVAAPTTHHTETVVRAALDAGVDYLDIQYADSQAGCLARP